MIRTLWGKFLFYLIKEEESLFFYFPFQIKLIIIVQVQWLIAYYFVRIVLRIAKVYIRGVNTKYPRICLNIGICN